MTMARVLEFVRLQRPNDTVDQQLTATYNFLMNHKNRYEARQAALEAQAPTPEVAERLDVVRENVAAVRTLLNTYAAMANQHQMQQQERRRLQQEQLRLIQQQQQQQQERLAQQLKQAAALKAASEDALRQQLNQDLEEPD